MINEDTICLLRECNSGTLMAVYSINEILENVKNTRLKELLRSSREHHEELGNRLHTVLSKYGDKPKEPNLMAKSMSWIKTNGKLAIEDSDRVCADLITDGCNMGVKSLWRYLNQYVAAEEQAQDMAKELIHIEENLARDLRCYL
jgi:hypothetical protein